MQLNKTYTKEYIIEKEHTAAYVGSGSLEVLSTPMMLCYMECTAKDSVSDELEPGNTTVGTAADLEHLAAVLAGKTVTVKSVLTEVDRRKLTFSIEAFHGDILIGRCIHTRFIVNEEKFTAKLS
ncbi:MAG: thioesterase family protein [Ruminococcus sp.]|jgi:predicted thioesterase|nr:thioesterase family protein [Ruminococcus sp.]